VTYQKPTPFKALYGPVSSWRFGQSLGVDPIGQPSTCSFNCAYCQLGDIQRHTTQRQVFVSTEQINQELVDFDPLIPMDVVTLSGSGEPTLALNLGDILTAIKTHLDRPVVVLTNSTLLRDPAVRAALQLADRVVAKLDAVSDSQLQRVNRPAPGIDIATLLNGIRTFSAEYQGHLALQTMLLKPWPVELQSIYIDHLRSIRPAEVQLNVPTRPRVLAHHLEARENQAMALEPHALRQLRCVDLGVLQDLADQIEAKTGIPTRYPPVTTFKTQSEQAFNAPVALSVTDV
jgi:wyosine [tRNA(Phe)-imidazoG37] synthetase (radical SAM superfamily)